MFKRGLLAYFCIFSSCISFSQRDARPNYNPDKKYSRAELQADLSLLKIALQEAHPGLYRYNTKEQINRRFDSISNSLQPQETELQFFSTVSKFIASIGCGHTGCFPSREYKKHYAEKGCRYFPFAVKILDERMYITSNFSTDSSIVCGSEVLNINGNAVLSLINILLPHIPSDGYNTTLKHHDLEDDFMFYYSELIGQPAIFQLQLKSPGDEMLKIATVPGLHFDEMQKINDKRMRKKGSRSIKEKPLQFRITNNDVAVLTIHSLDGAEIAASKQRFHSFIRNVFDTIRNKGISDLIIDLRNNGGGDDDYGWYLYSFLTDSAFRYYDQVEVASDKKLSFIRHTNQPRIFNLMHHFVKHDDGGHCIWTHGSYLKVHQPVTNNYKGHVFVLINGESFSATAEFAAMADYHKRAVFIGEETGGAYEGNNSGVEILLTLPNTHIRVNIPVMKYVCAVGTGHPLGRGVMPRYQVQPSIDDILRGVDTEMDFTLDLIRKKNCKACGR